MPVYLSDFVAILLDLAPLVTTSPGNECSSVGSLSPETREETLVLGLRFVTVVPSTSVTR
jgi:hypothetical protein